MKKVIDNLDLWIKIALMPKEKLMCKDGTISIFNNGLIFESAGHYTQVKEDMNNGKYWYDDGVKEKVPLDITDIKNLFYQNAKFRDCNGYENMIVQFDKNSNKPFYIDYSLDAVMMCEKYVEYTIDGKEWKRLEKDAE
jgi:hypothetical protein